MTSILDRQVDRTVEPEEPWKGGAFDKEQEQIAEFLTSLLAQNKNGFVLSIDSAWGTGKTHFLLNWKVDISNRHPCFYFNAWETDYVPDAFTAFFSEFVTFLEKLKSDVPEANLDKIIKTGGKIALGLGPMLAKAGLRKFLGDEGLDDFKDLLDSNTKDELITKIGELTTQALKQISEQKELRFEFKRLIGKMLDGIEKQQAKKLPMFVFIDELDRCRPNYAIELLENIKHIFQLPNIVFVVATDTEQLSHSVRSVYGYEFDSTRYLQRFFDQTYLLKISNYSKFTEFLFMSSDFDPVNNQIKLFAFDNNPIRSFSTISDLFRLSLREQQRLFFRVRAAIKVAKNVKTLHVELLMFLVVLQIRCTIDYKKFINDKRNLNDIWESAANCMHMPERFRDYVHKLKIYSRRYFSTSEISNIINESNVFLETNDSEIKHIEDQNEILSYYLKDFSGYVEHFRLVELAGNLN